ncbi:hypothetical protein PR202_ga20554 [Eleusine coracana subsp. coracana]|uniref:Uncharacterized protein n=1 Tax=Eleusine coracana subsp. coracana TaxID=191504 RepID=A0AAV5CXQ8_ELECO|nr:hypothetical protein PR202_ga20554 [Eleusine coracana subsp. coracana]
MEGGSRGTGKGPQLPTKAPDSLEGTGLVLGGRGWREEVFPCPLSRDFLNRGSSAAVEREAGVADEMARGSAELVASAIQDRDWALVCLLSPSTELINSAGANGKYFQ